MRVTKTFPKLAMSAPLQVISHQVITGEQGKKYCETLVAPFERHDSEFSVDVRSRKKNLTVLIYHVIKSTYYESLSVT